MATLSFYGSNDVVISGENCTKTKAEIVTYFQEKVSQYPRQKERAKNDVAKAQELEETQKYRIISRQYSGHKYLPSTVIGEGKNIIREFISDVVDW